MDWLGHPAAQGVLALAADARPAWLWSADGETLMWRNRAARLFGARISADALVLLPPAQPIRGMTTRILRFGMVGRPTRSRVQFLAASKPLAAPCLCTPLAFGDDSRAVLIVGEQPIDADLFDHPEAPDRPAAEAVAPELPVSIEGAEPDGVVAETDAEEPVAEVEAAPNESPSDASQHEEDVAPPSEGTLAGLFARLARHDELYAPLGDEDDLYDPDLVHSHALAPADRDEPLATDLSWREAETETEPEPEWLTGDEGASDDPDEPIVDSGVREPTEDTPTPALWTITGRGFMPSAADFGPDAEAEVSVGEDEMPAPPLAPEIVERQSRYNFEELSRILNDRVGREPSGPDETEETPPQPVRSAPVVALSEESLVLNRLPVGILLFRDQDILFVNRALVDLTGHESATALREMGLAAIIPSVEGHAPAGPVSQLLCRDGTRVVVTARLQSVSWQGRPAFMLSARVPETRPQDEHAIKTFSALLSAHLDADMLVADRTGLVTQYIAQGATTEILQPGDALTRVVDPAERGTLQRFLESPAPRSDLERASLRLRLKDGATLLLFVEGRLGPASGFFGFVLPLRTVPASDAGTLPSAALERIGRDLRRPLATILGFAELMTAESFGPLGPRYLEYARDIESAGRAIGDLADELEDFAKLATSGPDGHPGDVADLSELLGTCLSKIRTEAIASRVLLRSSISERLPRVRVDAPSLSQAVLNLLASAIRHSEEGGRVVLSAQQEPDGAISIHVRDTAAGGGGDIADRFVIFREGRERDGSPRQSAASSIGLTLTRSLIAVNALSLSIDPATDHGTLMTLSIPRDRVVEEPTSVTAPEGDA